MRRLLYAIEAAAKEGAAVAEACRKAPSSGGADARLLRLADQLRRLLLLAGGGAGKVPPAVRLALAAPLVTLLGRIEEIRRARPDAVLPDLTILTHLTRLPEAA